MRRIYSSAKLTNRSSLKAILRVGIEGDVQDGLLGLAVGDEVVAERAGKMPYRVRIIALRLDNPAGEKHVGVPFVHFNWL